MKKMGVFSLLIFSLCQLAWVEGNYEFQVRVYSYSHTNRRDFQGRHCDVFPSDSCENIFLFCLQAYGTSQTSTYCPYGSFTTSGSPRTATTGNFGDGLNGIAPGVHNPLVFRGDTGNAWIGGFQFQIRIDDDDHPDSDDLIDRVFVTDSSLAISDTFTPRRTYTGIYRNVQIDLSYRAICQTNYYGSLCTVFCSGRNDSGGRYECNGEGERVCLTGWTDLQNNCLTPICSPSCPPNFECSAPAKCTCVSGWTGQNCTQCIPATGCTHGSCESPGECLCDPGYSGTLCQVDEDVCGHQSPCVNGGTCNNTGPDSHVCSCPATFSGPNCEEDVDECVSNPCLNGGICLNNHGDTHTCICVAGYTGQNCGTEIDECESTPCQNGATCNDLLDNFNCSCLSGFTGPVCDINIDDCHPDFCLRGGTCVDQVDGYTCDCLPQFTGRQCEETLPPPCSSIPCGVGTFCVENIEENTFTCEICQQGVEGCSNIILIDPDAAQQGRNNSDIQPKLDGPLIGAIVGGVVVALLLLCLIVVMVMLCMRWCTCCPCVSLKSSQDETYETIGAAAQQNPLYLGTSTLLSSQSGTLRSSASMPRYRMESPCYVEFSHVASGEKDVDVSAPRQHSNPMYAEAQAAIHNGTPLTLPAHAPPKDSMDHPAAGHYERISGDYFPDDTEASSKYNRLKPKAKHEAMLSGKYDSLSPAATENAYVIDRGDGYKLLPGNPRPMVTMTSTKNDLPDTPVSPTNFDPNNSS